MNCIKRNSAGRKVNINMMELRGFFEQFKKDITLSNNIFGGQNDKKVAKFRL